MQAYKKNIPIDVYELYEASVQNIETDINFAKRVFKRYNNKIPKIIREDFCGTAKLAINWALKDDKNKSIGIDLNKSTLQWSKKNSLSKLNKSQKNRVKLLNEDVLNCITSKVDITFALNFSYFYFRERQLLKKYLHNVKNSLKKNGLIIMDIYGGTESVIVKQDDPRTIQGFTSFNNIQIPDFEYIWDQKKYNPINNYTTCSIHFKIPKYGYIKDAFTYEWRLWSIPEILEIMTEVGFKKTAVYLHDFDDEGISDEIFRVRKNYENTEGWIAYIVGIN